MNERSLVTECVHHIDRNRKNNDPSNLMVFKSNSDHIGFHAGGIAELLPDGSYQTKIDDDIRYQYILMNKSDQNKESIDIIHGLNSYYGSIIKLYKNGKQKKD